MLLKLLLVVYTAMSLAAGQTPAVGGSAYRSSAPTHSTTKHPRLPVHASAQSRVGPIASTGPRINTAPRITLFSGLNKPGLKATDNPGSNASFVPPDTTGSIGPGYYIETVNSRIALYNRVDLSLKASTSFQAWLNNTDPLCDPQIQWDNSSQRWLYVVLGCDISLHYFLFGWSRSSDPSDFAGGWCRFTRNTPGELTDYPKLGHSANYMIVGTNDFPNLTTFDTAQIFWMATPPPGDNVCSTPVVNSAGSKASPLRNDDNSLAFTPVPVNTMTGATDGYVLAAYDAPAPSLQNHIAIWHVDAAGVLLKDADIAINTYAAPNHAPNPGGSYLIDTLDGRLTQAVGDPTLGMWTQHTVSPSLGSSVRSQVDWYELQVAGGVPGLTQEGAIVSATDYVFNAAISPTFDGLGTVVEYNRSSSSLQPLIAAQSRTTSTPSGQMDPGEVVIATSSDADVDFSCNNPPGSIPPNPCRWGDYSGAMPDPLAPSVVWGANQTLENHAGHLLNVAWVTRIFAIVVQPRQITPTGAAAGGSRSGVTQVSPAPTPPPR